MIEQQTEKGMTEQEYRDHIVVLLKNAQEAREAYQSAVEWLEMSLDLDHIVPDMLDRTADELLAMRDEMFDKIEAKMTPKKKAAKK